MEPDSGLTLALAERSYELAPADVPDDVREIASQALLDWFGVTLGGSREDGPLMLLALLCSDAGDEGEASVIGHPGRLGALQAALLNGTSSHALDYDDVNLTLLGHVSVAILAGALALAEQLDATASDLLTAYVAGYETTCRVAAALGPEPYLRGFHATGTAGTFGAAAACAKLLGLDAAQTASAFGIAASEAAGLKCNFGTMTKPLHAGRACESGLLAASLAARGFTANPRAIEGEQGFAAISGGFCDEAAALADPPSGWHLHDNLFKHHASCFFTHSTIEGLRDLTRSGELDASEVARVSIHVSDVELGTCVIPEPRTGLEVKFSIGHLAAMTLLGRSTSSITDADAGEEQTVALRSKVALLEDGLPGRPTRVDVTLEDGRTVSACRDVNLPERDLAVQRGRLSEKFLALAEPALGEPGARRLLDGLSELDGARAVSSLTELARPAMS